jgi:hypothetical protein
MDAVAPDRRLAGRYVLVDTVATGGMATVWRGYDEVLARTVAVKVLRDDLATDPDFLQRFQTEAVSAARLTHPSIVSIFDTGVDDDVSYIVMEYFEGRTLRELMIERGVFDTQGTGRVMVPVLAALGFAHEAGVVHRDIKPGNILVSDDGRTKVVDFGIAKAAYQNRDLTTTGTVLGTARYVSPEQVEGLPLDGRSDLYSAGVVLYEMLAGRPPFDAETHLATAMMRLTRDPPSPASIRPGIPRGLDALVMRAMARRPEDRYPSADAMRAALERFGTDRERTLPHRTVAAARPARSETRPRGAFRSWMLVPLIVLAAAAAFIGGGLALGRLTLGGPLGVRGNDSERTSTQTASELRIKDGQDYDPQGDGSEHPESVPLAFDGDPATSWTTDHYSNADFGALKDGLGLWVDLGSARLVTKVTITSSIRGWAFQLKDGSLNDLSPALKSTSGATTFTMKGSGEMSIGLSRVPASGLLIWITKLGSDTGGHAASIAEVKVFGTNG